MDPKLLKKFQEKSKQNELNRSDLRFQKSVAFLASRGLLGTNRTVPRFSRGQRLDIEDVLWAGTQVEPRILEVLPAAVICPLSPSKSSRNWSSRACSQALQRL